jgi:hypothetical protein
VESRSRVLKQVVGESLYVVDELAVADAIMLRAKLRLVVADQSFRSATREPRPRSFRRDRDARSFRLTGSPRLRHIDH